MINNKRIITDFLSFNLGFNNGIQDKLSFFKGILAVQVNANEVQKKYNLSDLKKEIKEDGSSRIIMELTEIKAGSIIDISYQVETNILYENPDWNFLNTYPNLYSELNFSIPDFFG